MPKLQNPATGSKMQTAAEPDKLANVQNQVTEVRAVMTNNIDQVLNRGEKLDNLVTKSEQLGDQATRFKGNARTLKRQMCWQNYKMKLTFLVILLILIGVIVLIACLTGSHRCGR